MKANSKGSPEPTGEIEAFRLAGQTGEGNGTAKERD